jgi:hypothetical protein
MSELVKCKACGREIAKGVKKCPHCGKDQRNFFMKHKIITGILALIIIVVISSALSGGNTPKKVGENNAASTTSNTDAKKSETKTFKVGDVVQLKDLKITVNKVYNVKGNDVFKPKDGNEFIAVDCTVENISSKEQAISSMLMFKVVDKDGRAAEYSLSGQSAANAGQLDGTVGAGRKLTGVYAVEIPKGTTGLELEFDSSLFTGGQVIVKLN